MKCCESCCKCKCHNITNVESCSSCCQREFKKGDWVKGTYHNSFIYYIEKVYSEHGIDYVKYANGGGFDRVENVKHHTLTADDLIPCPYCGGKMELNNNIDGSWCYCPNNRCRLSLGLRKTVREAVADVLLSKMREEACDF